MLNEEIVQHDNGDTNHFILREGQGKLEKEKQRSQRLKSEMLNGQMVDVSDKFLSDYMLKIMRNAR